MPSPSLLPSSKLATPFQLVPLKELQKEGENSLRSCFADCLPLSNIPGLWGSSYGSLINRHSSGESVTEGGGLKLGSNEVGPTLPEESILGVTVG